MRFSQNSPLSDHNRQALYQVLFLILVVLVVYCRAVTGTIVSIDDAGIMKFYGSDKLTLLDALRPGQGYYYRPVIALNFYLDYHLLGQNPLLLHLENILIHAANTVLVFLLASRLLSGAEKSLPLVAALAFAVHPVNSEAVSWIAGRTDPLAAFFVLLASLSLLNGLENGRVRHTILSVLFLAAGVLTKETAILFVPASLLLVVTWRHLRPGGSPAAAKLQGRVLGLVYLGVSLLMGVILLSRTGPQNSVAKLLIGNTNDLWGSFLLCLRLFGFYLKKIFVPWPLNFAITEVAAWYLIPAAAGIVFLLLAPKRNIRYVSVCMGLLFLLPALVVGVCDVAWTVVAERYLYIPSAFICIGLTGYLSGAAERMRLQRFSIPVFYLLIAAAAVSTLHRTAAWQSNLALFQDTVAKTPDFGMLRNELALALALDGRLEEASRELDVASSLDLSEMVKGMVRRNRMLISIEKGTPEERRRQINLYGWKLLQDDAELLTLLRRNDYLILPTLADGAEKDALISEMVQVSERLFSLTREPILLYNNGQLLLGRGDRQGALSYFTRCAEAAPEGAYYKAAACKLAARLGGSI